MKEYLRSAVGLVREAAWSFPTFKEKATHASGEFDPDSLSPEEMDALLEHAFERYFATSGLFGSPDTCRRFVERLGGIGVDEVACLVDFGVPSDTVLAHLPRLAEVARSFGRDDRARPPAGARRGGDDPGAHRGPRRHALPVHADDGPDPPPGRALAARARSPAPDAGRRRSPAGPPRARAGRPRGRGRDQRLRAHGDDRLVLRGPRAPGRLAGDHRVPDREHEPARPRPRRPPRAGRPRRRAAHRREGRRPRLLEPPGPHRRALRAEPVRRGPPLPHGRPRAPPRGRRARVPRAPRPPGEGPRPPDRARRDRGAPGGAPRGPGSGRRRARRRRRGRPRRLRRPAERRAWPRRTCASTCAPACRST